MFSASVSACFELENRPDLAYFTRTVNDWFDTLDSRRAKCSNNRLKNLKEATIEFIESV